MRPLPRTFLGMFVVGGAVSCAAAPPPPVTLVEVAAPVAPPPAPVQEPAETPGEAPEEVARRAAARKAALRDAAEFGTISPGGMRPVSGAGFRYEVQDLWEELDPATLGSDLIRSAQRNTMPVDGFMTNVNVASEPFVGDGPAYADANLIELRKVSTIRDQRASRAGDRPAFDIEAHWPNPGGVPYVTVQRYATDGRQGFVITCSAAASAFEVERPVCARVLDSFRVE